MNWLSATCGGALEIAAAQDQIATRRRSQTPIWLRIFVGFFLLIFLSGGFYSAYLFYATIREIVGRAELSAIPHIQLPSISLPEAAADERVVESVPVMPEMTPGSNPGELAFAPPPAPYAPVNDDRTNILLLGIDRRGEKGWGYRTDTIIIVTVDEANRTAGMLSIPRDLQVPIPGNGEDRINTANVWGESRNYPGGGPALLKRTLEVDFGIPIDYYVMVDFQGFEKIIDTLGGIEVDVPKELHDAKYPDPKPRDPHAYKTIHFNPGLQQMDGVRALEYARSRMSTSDFDRAKRQQHILLAIRERALNLNLLPKLPTLAATMMDTVKTDMTLDDMLQLAGLVPHIDMGNLKQVVIQKPLVYGYRREDGAAVQLPKWDLIDPVVADLFTAPVVVIPTPTPAAPIPTPTLAAEQIEDLQELAGEGARIAVQNGTSEPNFAARVAAMLMEQGYQVVEFGDADRLDYSSTVVVDYTSKAYTLGRLVEAFNVAPENVRQSTNLRSQIDIRIIVGEDFRLSSP
jgi:LCP family protein required for cell wall assembly